MTSSSIGVFVRLRIGVFYDSTVPCTSALLGIDPASAPRTRRRDTDSMGDIKSNRSNTCEYTQDAGSFSARPGLQGTPAAREGWKNAAAFADPPRLRPRDGPLVSRRGTERARQEGVH